jgi:hypothetical protein
MMSGASARDAGPVEVGDYRERDSETTDALADAGGGGGARGAWGGALTGAKGAAEVVSAP